NAHFRGRQLAEARGDRAPRAGRVDDRAGAHAVAPLVHQIARRDLPIAFARSREALDRRVVVELGAVLLGVDGVQDAEPRAVDAPLVERDAAGVLADEAGLELREIARVEPRVRLAVLERLIRVVRAEVRVDQLDQDPPFFPL